MSILITGANGQLGTVLSRRLTEIYGSENVLRTDITASELDFSPFEFLNILDPDSLIELIEKYDIKHIYHLAAILSANGERDPRVTWNINLESYRKMLTIARQHGIERIFFPSTIAVFGKTSPREMTPQNCHLLPTTVYGMSKVTGELWNEYCYNRYGLDVRSVRYPGIIGYQSMPGGGTTDYAVEIFHEALKTGSYTSYIAPDTRLPMIYMADAINATIQIMQAPIEDISLHYGYNIAGMSFTPAELAEEIKKHLPDFEMHYEPDYRDEIAQSWPSSIDDSVAREDWGWNPEFSLAELTEDMLKNLRSQSED